LGCITAQAVQTLTSDHRILVQSLCSLCGICDRVVLG